MADLLQCQIRESCKLALPEGLKELMSDISREVLRTQPQDIYHFISNYLGALLKARETLSIACFICNETLQSACEPASYDELRDIGLHEEDIGKTVEVIKKKVKVDLEVDGFGLRGLSCPRSSGRLSRHGSLNYIIKRALATIDVPALIEPSGISRDDGKRPVGLTLVPWERGRALLWDATCVDTLAPSHLLREAVLRAGVAAERAEFNKRLKEASLFAKLIRKTSLDELQISAVQIAVQRAYRRHRFSQSNIQDHGNEMDDAVSHTLSLYRESTSKTEQLLVAPEFKRHIITKKSQKVVFIEAKVASINKYQEKIYNNNKNELDDNNSVNEEIIEEIVETNDSERSIEECLNISLYDNDDWKCN